MILVLSVEELIAKEVGMYLQFCCNAAKHDEQEFLWRQLAHVTFYHLQELKTTGKVYFASPITTK